MNILNLCNLCWYKYTNNEREFCSLFFAIFIDNDI